MKYFLRQQTEHAKYWFWWERKMWSKQILCIWRLASDHLDLCDAKWIKTGCNLESAGHCPCKRPQRCRCSGGSKTPSPEEAARVVASWCQQSDAFKKIWNPEAPCACFFQELVQLNSALTLHVLVTTHDCSIWCVLLLSLSLSLSLFQPLPRVYDLCLSFILKYMLMCSIFGVYCSDWSLVSLFFCLRLVSFAFRLPFLTCRSTSLNMFLTSWFLPPCFLQWWVCKSLTATKWVLRAWQKIFSETPCKLRETNFISFLSYLTTQKSFRTFLYIYIVWIPMILCCIPTQTPAITPETLAWKAPPALSTFGSLV